MVVFITIVDIILFGKIVFDILYLVQSYKFIHSPKLVDGIERKVKILLLIPVLREQKVIESTLNHFSNFKVDNIELMVCIAGSSSEKQGKGNEYVSTGDIVKRWINSTSNSSIRFEYREVDENESGERAARLNYVVAEVRKTFSPDIIGLYDADSLPDIETLMEVATIFNKNPNVVLQQPVHFINASNNMSGKVSPILVANALYQTTWTMIRELPRWYNHHQHCGKSTRKYLRNDYLIGHGEFIPTKIYDKFKFPENEITDGIQVGYRLSMSGVDIAPLHLFCDDDVPKKIRQLIQQHKRWFGGCNRLFSANKWAKNNGYGSAILQVLDGLWSQACWAFAAIFVIISLVLSIVQIFMGSIIPFFVTFALCLIYWYVIPVIAHYIIPTKKEIRFIDWLALPIAMAIKGIGPNLYFVQKVWNAVNHKRMSYTKVER